MVIGVPKEIMHGEARVAATPETCASLLLTDIRCLLKKVLVWVRTFWMRLI